MASIRHGNSLCQDRWVAGLAHGLEVTELQLPAGKGHLSNGCHCHAGIQEAYHAIPASCRTEL